MEPTIHCAKPAVGCQGTVDDRVVVRVGAPIHRKGIVVFQTPPKVAMECGETGIFVKRLIGLPGETVHEDRHGFLAVDGKPLAEPYIPASDRRLDTMFAGKTWHVPKGGYFVVGDNRSMSCDSRAWGSVPAKDIIGPVTKILRGTG